jgi:hypothetical protein
LTAFGASQSLSAYQLPSLVALNAPASYSGSDFAPVPFAISTAGTPRTSFAASLALSSRFALDSGYNADIAQRFGNYDGIKSPLLDSGDVLSLADGGTYVGATWMPAATLHVRAGASLRGDRLDHFSFGVADGSLPLAHDASQSRSLLAGISWDVSDWASFGLNAIRNEQFGAPFGVNPLGNLTGTSRVGTDALSMAARVKLGDNWVTTASYSDGLSQLDQRAVPAPQHDTHSYFVAVAKHGLFGDDALGFSFSRPTPGVLDNGFDMVAASGDLPPMFVATGHFPDQAPETDLQLGYVVSFQDGALALQTNAAYQMNYQGQSGATALSVLSRAKIKF